MRDQLHQNYLLRHYFIISAVVLVLFISLSGNLILWLKINDTLSTRSCDVKRTKRSVTLEYEIGTPASFQHSNDVHDDEKHYFFPLFTQLTESQITKICKEKYRKSKTTARFSSSSTKHQYSNKYKTESSNISQQYSRYQYSLVDQRVRSQKVCAPIQALNISHCVGERVYRFGSAMRKGDQWLLTEFTTGNTIFQFGPSSDTSASSLMSDHVDKEENVQYEINDKRSIPKQAEPFILQFPNKIHTLTDSFYGTDHTVDKWAGELIFYYISDRATRLRALHLSNGRQLTRLLDATNKHLYKHDSNVVDDNMSAVDLEADDGVLWVLFCALNDTVLSVTKMESKTLKEIARYRLTLVHPWQITNAFISCGVLYTVDIEKKIKEEHASGYSNTYIRRKWRRAHYKSHDSNHDIIPKISSGNHTLVAKAIFDFHSERYIKPKRTLNIDWPYDPVISNVQYDTETDSLTIFSSGKIFTVQLTRGIKPET